tara:strand:+ start:226 stop:627 length:402 start_codon:yes stop_codon:yes gene_type:complete
MSKKKFLQSNNTEEYLEFLSDNELMDKIRKIVKEKLTIEQAVSIPNIKNTLMSEHSETFRKQQYAKLENIYKTHWYRNKFYGFLEKDEYAYGFETFFDLTYTHIEKIYNLDIIFENDKLLLEVFEKLRFKNEL